MGTRIRNAAMVLWLENGVEAMSEGSLMMSGISSVEASGCCYLLAEGRFVHVTATRVKNVLLYSSCIRLDGQIMSNVRSVKHR